MAREGLPANLGWMVDRVFRETWVLRVRQAPKV